jgi:hypothetical protein
MGPLWRHAAVVGNGWEIATAMSDVGRYANGPIAFIFRFVRRRWIAHGAILLAVLAAVSCSVSTQYGIKLLVDTLASNAFGVGVWSAFAPVVALVAADNLLSPRSSALPAICATSSTT